MLAEKPDECIHTLDLDKLGLPTVHAFADLGPIRNNQSLKKIDKAFNKMALR